MIEKLEFGVYSSTKIYRLIEPDSVMKAKGNDCIYCEKHNVGLMICCDRCESWYHYRCVHKKWDLTVRRSHLRYLAKYYCYPCRRAVPYLKLQFDGQPENADSTTEVETENPSLQPTIKMKLNFKQASGNKSLYYRDLLQLPARAR